MAIQRMAPWLVVVAVACAPVTPPRPASDAGAGPDTAAAVASEPGADAVVRARAALDTTRQAYEAVALERALEQAGRLVARYPTTDAADTARWVAARAAFALGRFEEAAEYADAAVRAFDATPPAEEARVLADLAEDALRTPAAEPVVVGAVLPRTGPRVLVRYADWLLEGVELAIAEAERRQGRRIELVVADDSGGVRVPEAIRSLERRGVLAIVGPLLPEYMRSAALARSGDDPLLISPTATDAPRYAEAYSVNSSDTRGAHELARYTAALGLDRAALLYPRLPEFERKARAFADEYQNRGGVVRAMVPYDSGTTTFDAHMERILEAVAPREPGVMGDPFALFVAAPEKDVPQIAPQVSFYGLDSAGVQVLGDEAWAGAAVRRVVPDRDLEGVIAASHFPPGAAAGMADSAFIRAYEARYRRSLDNRLPALGYDAARLVLEALPNRRLTPDALARRFRFLAGIRGATGVLSVRDGAVVRIPYLVTIRDGELAPAPYPWEYARPVPRPLSGQSEPTAR